jgi:hypothetical protein
MDSDLLALGCGSSVCWADDSTLQSGCTRLRPSWIKPKEETVSWTHSKAKQKAEASGHLDLFSLLPPFVLRVNIEQGCEQLNLLLLYSQIIVHLYFPYCTVNKNKPNNNSWLMSHHDFNFMVSLGNSAHKQDTYNYYLI